MREVNLVDGKIEAAECKVEGRQQRGMQTK